MSTVGIDHIAMPTANAERLIEFYKRIGFTINDEDDWRAGKVRAFSIQVGNSKINVHPEGHMSRAFAGRRQCPAAPTSASSGTALLRSASRCWSPPAWRS